MPWQASRRRLLRASYRTSPLPTKEEGKLIPALQAEGYETMAAQYGVECFAGDLPEAELSQLEFVLDVIRDAAATIQEQAVASGVA